MPTDPILGPAWPALLAPGLRVVHAPNGPATVVWIDDDGDPWVTFDAACADERLDGIEAQAVVIGRVSVDYAHPATRDAVCRALAPGLRNPARFVPFGDYRWGLTTDEVAFGAPGWPRVWRPTPQGDMPVAPGLAGLSGPLDVQWALALRAVAAAVWGGE